MAPERSCTTPVKGRSSLKKGPWTATEDMLLVEYVKKHGEGNWNAVQRNSGLMRCGKSCRLRWANHLRPNLKKGAFSLDEEKLIVDLHAKLGNKWARMAAQLPGRTDNEIKNYWNTRLKRRQRAGLPIYPQELHPGQQNHQLFSSLQPSISSMLASSHLPNPNPNPFCFIGSFTSPASLAPPPHQSNVPLKRFNENNSSLSLTLNPAPFYSNSLPMPSLVPYNSLDFGINSELPSIQSAGSSSEFVMDTSSDDAAEDYEVDRSNKSGLLEDLLGESQALTGHENAKDSFIAPADQNQHEESAFGFGHVDETSENQLEGENQKGFGEVTDSGDEDLLNLLDNFPLAVPIPNWNEQHGYESPNPTHGTSSTMESRHEDTQYNVAATTPSGSENQDWNFGVCLWNNMPNIY